ncbi:MAG: hypothetical protein KBT27_11370 [Prevotellaceae bacterium]|nr:hypothetical protein [Candidatus Faecinaster equi]
MKVFMNLVNRGDRTGVAVVAANDIEQANALLRKEVIRKGLMDIYEFNREEFDNEKYSKYYTMDNWKEIDDVNDVDDLGAEVLAENNNFFD